ncbi:ABC transporter permease [Parasporobacterium paucivorans]|uniref:ABC-2 type transport system permease protein n=1 Tax=Parasporobacterium paucivorans DSM 15970 TaxID=1122934 RepID=A0A1M6K5N7_9FIRM|nr:ABC transporter permease [Parasporobacterium paucivorans]SHJ54187.1 ABC-2 type transport system permease protein [Parasporobacterium paucivorans DSM 15970]
MPVFKLCLKIIKKNLPLMIMYMAIFLVVSVVIASANKQNEEKATVFTSSRTAMAFLSEEDTPLTRGLKQELAKVAVFVEIENSDEAVKDALFFRKVFYALKIPEGFSEDFMSGKAPVLETIIVPGTIPAVYLEMAVNQYLNTARLYVDSLQGIGQAEVVQSVAKDLENSSVVVIPESDGLVGAQNFSSYFFNYLAYSLLSVLILGVSSIMIVLKDKDISRRNHASPVSRNSMTVQIFMAMVLLTLGAWVAMTGACFLLNIKGSLNVNFLMFMLNSFVFALAGTGISFLIASVIKGRNALSAVNNVVTLGSSFLGGVFVPQQFLGPAVLQFSKFLPTYWYVKANNLIGFLTVFDPEHTAEVFKSMGVVAAFGAAAFAASLILDRRGRLS